MHIFNCSDFTVNLVMASAFSFNLIEFLRLGDAVWTFVEILKSYSRPEARARIIVRKTVFWFGDAYSYELFIFVLCVSLGVSIPIILPFGLMFFLIKHCISSFNLRNKKDFRLTNVGLKFHMTAISYVTAAPVCLQFYTGFYLNIQSSKMSMALTSGFVCILSSLLYMLQVSSRWKFPLKIVVPRKKTVRIIRPSDDIYVPPYIEQNMAFIK